MRSGPMCRGVASMTWLSCALTLSLILPVRADDPKGFGRFFRLGSASDSSKSSSPSASAAGAGSTPIGASPYRPAVDPYAPPALSTPPTTSTGSGSATASPRITPKPRSTKAVTEADPLVTRIALGRADGGSQFGMFMQVYADGTVIDGEGVHKVSPDVLKPVVEAVSSNDFSKVKGHCGGPAGDTFETIHMVTYERAYGRLRANSFSYSGNPQGCDHAVHHLHKVLEDLQLKLSTPAAAVVGAAASMTTPMVVSPAMSATPAMSSAPAMSMPMSTGASGNLPMPSLPDPGLH